MTLILAWFHTFVKIDPDIIYTVILNPSAESFKKGSCQLQAKVCAQEKWWLGEPRLTIAVDMGYKATQQTNEPIFLKDQNMININTTF